MKELELKLERGTVKLNAALERMTTTDEMLRGAASIAFSVPGADDPTRALRSLRSYFFQCALQSNSMSHAASIASLQAAHPRACIALCSHCLSCSNAWLRVPFCILITKG